MALILRKFVTSGFEGHLNWLAGGFNALARHPDAHMVLVMGHASPESDAGQSTDAVPGRTANAALSFGASSRGQSLRMSLSMPPSLTTSPTTPTPRPVAGNQASSSRRQMNSNVAQPSKTRPAMTIDMFTRTPAALDSRDHYRPDDKSSKEGTTTPQNDSTHPHSHQLSTKAPHAGRAKPAVNPFFDNIRQLNERLSLDVSLQNLTPVKLPKLRYPGRDLGRLPAFFRRLLEEDEQARARRLAHEFHDLEMAEQRRLQDVMRWHSSQRAEISSNRGDGCLIPVAGNGEGGVLDGATEHPFSISAGVELGYKNRCVLYIASSIGTFAISW